MAVGLARLEVPATLVSQVGHDERGGLVVQHVTSSGAEFVAVPTSTRAYVGRHRAPRRGRRGQLRLRPRVEPAPQELPPCRALHVGSLGTLLEPGRESVLDLVEQAGARDVFVSYDANLRESFIDDRARVRREVLDLGAGARWSSSATRTPCCSIPPRIPTTSPARCSAASAPSSWCSPAEPVGRPRSPPRARPAPGRARSRWWTRSAPGDAFMAATLAQLSDLDAFRRPGPGRARSAREEHRRRLLRGAMEVAAITCERRGANPPRRQELPAGWPA